MKKSTILTTCLSPTIYDMTRLMNVDKVLVVSKLPYYMPENVASMHLPSCSNKQVNIATKDTNGLFCSEIEAVNIGGFFRNLRAMCQTGYADAPNVDLVLDIVDLWHANAETAKTLAQVNNALIKVLKAMGYITAELIYDETTVDQDLCDMATYSDRLTSALMDTLFIYKGHTRSMFNNYLILSARESLCNFAYQRVDLANPHLDALKANIDITNTSFLEVFAWTDEANIKDAFKLRLYADQ
ncbi:hypothetical protein VpasPP24_89 [Vibrio phage Vpas_PP24]|nr:hypothetical protein VpasPP24_89 [Vibrio phage Vpas_PP24]